MIVIRKNNLFLSLAIFFFTSCSSVQHMKYQGEKFKITVASADVKALNLNEKEVLQDIQSVLSESYVIDMYDRQRLEVLLKEKNLSVSGLVEQGNFSKIGEFEGIEGVVTLRSYMIGDTAYLTLQLFNTKNAEVMSSVFFIVSEASKPKIFAKLKEYSTHLSNGLVERTSSSKRIKTKLAVVLLEDLDQKEIVSKDIAKWIPILESGLVKNYNLSIISRNELEYIVQTQAKENKLYFKELLKKKDFTKIGNLSGVEYILIGSLNEVNGRCAKKFNLQAINTKDAQTLNAEAMNSNKMEIGLIQLANSMAERITQPREIWKSYNSSGTSCENEKRIEEKPIEDEKPIKEEKAIEFPNRAELVQKSILFPGFGQSSLKSESSKGAALVYLGLIGLGVIGKNLSDYNSASNQYRNYSIYWFNRPFLLYAAPSNLIPFLTYIDYHESGVLRARYERMAGAVNASIGFYGFIWGVSLIDMIYTTRTRYVALEDHSSFPLAKLDKGQIGFMVSPKLIFNGADNANYSWEKNYTVTYSHRF